MTPKKPLMVFPTLRQAIAGASRLSYEQSGKDIFVDPCKEGWALRHLPTVPCQPLEAAVIYNRSSLDSHVWVRQNEISQEA